MKKAVLISGIAVLLWPVLALADAGYALQFDGVDDYVNCGNGSVLEPDDSITIEAWFIPSISGSGIQHLLSKTGNSESPYALYYFIQSYNLRFAIAFTETGTSFTEAIIPTTNYWVHVTGVYNGSSMKLYINGELADSISVTGTINYWSGGDLNIGADDDDGDNLPDLCWNSQIDEVRIWNIARTQEEIQQTMHWPLNGNEEGLVGYWRFDEGLGDTAFDSSPSEIHGRLGNLVGPDDSDPAWILSTAPIYDDRTAWHVSLDGNDSTGDGSPENPFATIQYAIDQSTDGDTILIAAGVYTGEGNTELSSLGKAINIKGEFGVDSTVIDGGNSNNGFNLIAGDSLAPISIRNLVISQCINGISLPYYSGRADVSISNCLFVNNGNGISWDDLYSPLIIDSCKFINNSNAFSPLVSLKKKKSKQIATINWSNCYFSNNSTCFYEWGVYCEPTRSLFANCVYENNGTVILSSCTISNSVFLNNEIAFELGTYDWVVIDNSIIKGCTNKIAEVAGGYTEPSLINFSNCVLKDNNGGINGSLAETYIYLSNCLYANNYGAINFYGSYWADFVLTNCVISNNYSDAITIALPPEPPHFNVGIYNCIVSNNSGNGIEIIYHIGQANISIACNDVYNNNNNYSGIPDQTGLNGNISADPQFCYPDTGNYYLYDTSPCAPQNTGCGTLIGAYGVGCLYVNRAWHVSVDGNDETGDGSEEYPFATIQHGVDIAVDGDTVLLMPGTYAGEGNVGVSIVGKSISLIGDSGADMTIVDAVDTIGIMIGEETYPGLALKGIKYINSNRAISAGTYSLTIEDCIFDNNNLAIDGEYAVSLYKCNFLNNDTAVYDPGSFFSDYYSIDSCTFIGNALSIRAGGDVTNSYFADGGTALKITVHELYVDNCIFEGHSDTLFNLGWGRIDISNSVISNNFGPILYSSGGGEYAEARFRFENTIITNNQGGMNLDNSSMIDIISCLYAFNSGGIHIASPDPVIRQLMFHNSTFVYNDTSALTISNPYYQRYDIANCIISNNAGYGIEFPEELSDPDINIAYNNVYGNTLGNYYRYDDQTGINGNISTDPLFIGGEPFDFHLRLASPCIDAGDPIYTFDDDGSISDMGVYPFLHGIPSMTTLLSPDNGNVILPSSYLTWLRVANPYELDTVYYAVQIDDDSLFNSIDVDFDSVSGYNTSLDVSVSAQLSALDTADALQDDLHYFWRVNSKNKFGDESGFTPGPNYFYYNAINHPPSPPTSGFSPSGDEEIISLTPTITWNDASDPDPDDIAETLRYYFHLIEDTSTGGYLYSDTTEPGINQVALAEEIPDNSHFMYFVCTVDDEGLESEWTDLHWFWTNHYNYPPEPFPLYVPAPDLRRVDYYTYFHWGQTGDYDPLSSFAYTLQISPDSLFNFYVLTIDELTDTALTLVTDTLALAGGNLFWRVLAIDDDSLIRIGGLPESEVRKLTIVKPGDANGDGSLIGSDVTYMINFFRGINPAPDPLMVGDANGDCQVTSPDVTYLVRYFRGIGPAPHRVACEEAVRAR